MLRRAVRAVVLPLLLVIAGGALFAAEGAGPGMPADPGPFQLPYALLPDAALKLPPDWPGQIGAQALPRELPGRRVPDQIGFAELTSPQWTNRVVPLPEANTLAHLNFAARRLGRLQTGAAAVRYFNPQTILVKLCSQPQVGALRVEPMREWEAVRALRGRADVQFAELDTLEERQFSPNDPLLPPQWHHGVMGSFSAWNQGLGRASVQVAIVDTPFQMNHPDLAANTVTGWDAVANTPVHAAAGIVHSTLCAGLAAAVINNGVGVAGAANCQILPININGFLSEMYNGTVWAANHGVRVVSISWSGADSDTLEAAGYYLRTNAGGVLAMAATDGHGYVNLTNQPDVQCVSMTDAADNFTGTVAGPYVDFAAPGYLVYSTTTGGGYAYGTGTSYATPLFAGVVAWLLSLNPTLGPDDVVGLLQSTAVDLGPPGWDPYFGWGRINFGAAAAAATATLPAIAGLQITNQQATVALNFAPGLTYGLWRAPQLAPGFWTPVTNAVVTTNGAQLLLTDPSPLAGAAAFYRVSAARP